MLLTLAQDSDTMKVCKSEKCMLVLVEPWLKQGCLAEYDGVRLVKGAHQLHEAYQQLLHHLQVPYVLLPAMSVQDRVCKMNMYLQPFAA